MKAAVFPKSLVFTKAQRLIKAESGVSFCSKPCLHAGVCYQPHSLLTRQLPTSDNMPSAFGHLTNRMI